MRCLFAGLILVASCTETVAALSPSAAPVRHLWTNARTGETIVVGDGSASVGGRVYATQNCSTSGKWCIESDGPINLVANRDCDDLSELRVGDHQTVIWSVHHRTPLLRDRRSPQLLYEYSYRDGVTAIYYSPDGLGMTDSAGPDFSRLDQHRFERTGGPPFMACRR